MQKGEGVWEKKGHSSGWMRTGKVAWEMGHGALACVDGVGLERADVTPWCALFEPIRPITSSERTKPHTAIILPHQWVRLPEARWVGTTNEVWGGTGNVRL